MTTGRSDSVSFHLLTSHSLWSDASGLRYPSPLAGGGPTH